MGRFAIAVMLMPSIVHAEAMVANRTIQVGEEIAASDLSLIEANIPGAMSPVQDFRGVEARVTLFPGRPIKEGQIGSRLIVKRNQLVDLEYISSGLSIRTEGRAMDQAAGGEIVRVQNITSRSIVAGKVMPDGSVRVVLAEG